MVIENIMYFALGLLVAGLVALVIMPAVWKRAVRLTKRRIEAATPITMAEFRADKDQLRAEFALTTRRLEMQVETLRKRLAEQLSAADSTRVDYGALKAERDQHLAVVEELETRGAEMAARLAELERDSTDIAQRLRMRERELGVRTEEIASLRQALRGGLPYATEIDGTALSGDDDDIDRLNTALLIERKRAAFLEEQANDLLAHLEGPDRRGAEAKAAIARMREALSRKDEEQADDSEALVVAEARIANAESTLNSILAEATATLDPVTGQSRPLLADAFTLEDEVEALRVKVKAIEAAILADWDSERADPQALRAGLNDIATQTSRLVYAAQGEAPAPTADEESLFDRVQRFADDGENVEILPLKPAPPRRKGKISQRMTTLKELRGR